MTEDDKKGFQEDFTHQISCEIHNLQKIRINNLLFSFLLWIQGRKPNLRFAPSSVYTFVECGIKPLPKG
jgi:hypothetical protein